MEENIPPHHLQLTHAATVRNKRNRTRFQLILEDEEEKRNRLTLQTTKRPPTLMRKPMLNTEDRVANEKILKTMNHKMNYLRNPRSNPVIVTDDTSFFTASPNSIKFTDYKAGDVQTQSISFCNKSTTSRMLHISQPQLKSIFSIAPIKYPANCLNGLIAPGMSVTTIITFSPKTLEDYQDTLIASSESGKLHIPILGQREPPNITLPTTIDVGLCFVGDAKSVTIPFSNIGGTGIFRLYHPDDYPNNDIVSDNIKLHSFNIYPTEFHLAKNQSSELIIEFVPLNIGYFSYQFLVHCDNNQVRTFTIAGESRQVHLRIEDINHIAIDFDNPIAMRDLFFDSVFVGSEKSQEIVISNDSGLPVEYEWVLVHSTDMDCFKTAKSNLHEKHFSLQHSEDSFLDHQEVDELLPPATATAAIVTSPKGLTVDTVATDQAVPISKTMLLSLNQQMATTNFDSNRIAMNGFDIQPARGVISGEGLETFTFTYHPKIAELSDIQAVLVVKNVPYAAVPSPKQSHYIQQLNTIGHGRFMKFRSWLNEVSIVSEVDKYLIPSTAMLSTDLPIVCLNTLMGMVMSFVPESDFLTAVETFRYRINLLMEHVNCWHQNALREGDEKFAISPDHLTIQSFYLEHTAEGGSNHAASVTPTYLPKKLPTAAEQLITNQSNQQQQEQSGDSSEEDDGEDSDGNELIRHKVIPYEVDIISNQIWLDFDNAMDLLGDDLCRHLDQLIKHEAVDFLRSNSLTYVSYLSTKLAGKGKYIDIKLKEPFITLPGNILVGQPIQVQILLQNMSTSAVQVSLDTTGMSIIHSPINSMNVIDEENTNLSVSFEPNQLVLMPESESDMYLSLSFTQYGHYHLNIPITTETVSCRIDSLSIEATVICPSIRFDLSEINFGLIGIGQKKQIDFTIANETGIPIRYNFSAHIDSNIENIGAMTPSIAPSTRRNTGKYNNRNPQLVSPRESGSANSVALSRKNSRVSLKSGRSEDTSAHSIGMTSDASYQIENPSAVIKFEKNAGGVLESHQSLQITAICQAGSMLQRVRGYITCTYHDTIKLNELSHQYLNIRGEIQAPKAILTPLCIDLGVIYIGVPKAFQVTLQNLSNLPTKFKIDILSPNHLITYQLTYTCGTKNNLPPKESFVMNFTYLATNYHTIDELVGFKVFGIQRPLGFQIIGSVKGVSYALYRSVRRRATQPQLQLQEVIMGMCKLYEKKSTTFLVENTSEIPITYHIKVKQYFVVNYIEEAATRDSKGKLLLQAKDQLTHEKYYSKAGKEYLQQQSQIQENEKYLRSKLGIAYVIESRGLTAYPTTATDSGGEKRVTLPLLSNSVYSSAEKSVSTSTTAATTAAVTAAGTIPPWQSIEVSLTCYNDTPGDYLDQLQFIYLNEFHQEKIQEIPVHVTIYGCPVVIDKNTFGMSYSTEPLPVASTSLTSVSKSIDSQQRVAIERYTLHLGQHIVNSPSIQRNFILYNKGATNSVVKWELKNIVPGKRNGPVRFRLKREDSLDGTTGVATTRAGSGTAAVVNPYSTSLPKKCKLIFDYYDELELGDVPFSLDMMGSIIKYSQATFPVSCPNTDQPGKFKILATGHIEFPDQQRMLSPFASQRSVVNPSIATSSFDFPLMEPSQYLTESDHQQSVEETTAPKNNEISLEVDVELVYPTIMIDKYRYEVKYDNEMAVANHIIKLSTSITDLNNSSKQCMRVITFTNPLETALEFSIKATGPYAVIIDNNNKYTAKLRTTVSLATKPPPDADSAEFVVIPPHMSNNIRLVYKPNRSFRQSLTARTLSSDDTQVITEQEGSLTIAFATHQSLTIPLKTVVSQPYLVSSTPHMYFGVCQVKQLCGGFLLLSNTTNVTANWTCSFVPNGGINQRVTDIKVSGYENFDPEVDDPTVFEIVNRSGSLDGPCVSVAAALLAAPNDSVRYASDDNKIAPLRKTITSWMSQSLSLEDTVRNRHEKQHQFEADVFYPIPVHINFRPKKNIKYSSRLRFSCEYGNVFDVLLQGKGTYEEQDHQPLNPFPR